MAKTANIILVETGNSPIVGTRTTRSILPVQVGLKIYKTPIRARVFDIVGTAYRTWRGVSYKGLGDRQWSIRVNVLISFEGKTNRDRGL
jgi:hypothetical protein